MTGDRQRDPVGDLQAGVLASLLDRAHQVAGQALLGQLRRHLGVQHHEAAAAQHAGRRAPVGGAGDGLEGVLPLHQRQAAAGDGAVLGDRPVTGLRALDGELDVLAEARAGGPRVDGELLLHAVRRRLGRVGREQPDVLDVDLVADDRLEPVQRGRVGDDHGQRASGSRLRRLRALRSADAAEQTSRTRPSRRPARRRPAARRRAASRPGAPSGRRSARARSPRSSAASAARWPGRRPPAP